jgi:hypothetical protein
MTDKLSAKQVARHLDRRQTRRKLLLWAALAGAIALAITYLTCGRGWGLGGTGTGTGDGDGDGRARGLVATSDADPGRCAIFIAAEGITVDGMQMTRDGAVAACKRTAGADVIVAGDTRRGDWDDLKQALDAAGIEVFKREPTGAASDAGP